MVAHRTFSKESENRAPFDRNTTMSNDAYYKKNENLNKKKNDIFKSKPGMSM
jgi:hypothetical protein